MTPKSKGRYKNSHNSKTESTPASRTSPTFTQTSPFNMLATAPQVSAGGPAYFSSARPTLPPLSQIQSQDLAKSTRSPFTSPIESYRPWSNHVSPAAVPLLQNYRPIAPLSLDARGPQSNPMRLGGADEYQPSSVDADYSPTGWARPQNPRKRSLDPNLGSSERPVYANVNYGPGPSELDPNGWPMSSKRSSFSDPSTPTTNTSIFPPIGNPLAFSPGSSESSTSTYTTRCTLHIRQQPRAARAGPDGKDRRPIDPPPVLQLMMNDFDPSSPADMAEIQSTFWVVHCKLVSAQLPRRDMSTLSSVQEDGSREIQRLLLGTLVASPFTTGDDPDHDTMPSHPITPELPPDPPSPSSRFFPSSAMRSEEKGKRKAPSSEIGPSTFFIFPDLSVRKAGEYRLEFRLMRIEATLLTAGSSLPITHTILSQAFKVVNAKDFDQVQPSTSLVKGLLDRGAGFPLKLKKGTREGQRRRGPGGDDFGGGGDGDETEEEDDNEN